MFRRAAVRGLSETAAARMPTAEALLGAPPSSTCAASAAAKTEALLIKEPGLNCKAQEVVRPARIHCGAQLTGR